jgi:hypothetical protein
VCLEDARWIFLRCSIIKKPPNTIQRSPREWNLSFPIFQGSRDLSPPRSKESKAVYIQISLSLSLLIPSLFSFFFRYWELCVYAPCWERRRETCPADGPWSSQQRFPVESLSSRIQTGVEELRPVRVRLFLFENFSTTCVQIAIRHRQQQSTRVLLFFWNNSALRTNTPQRLFPSTPKKNRPLLFGNNHLNFGHGYFFQKEIIETFNHWKTFFYFYFQPVLFI